MEKRGGPLSQEFILTKDGNVVAVVTKNSSPLKSVYWIDITNDKNEYHPFIMAMVIVLACAQRIPGNPFATPHKGNVTV